MKYLFPIVLSLLPVTVLGADPNVETTINRFTGFIGEIVIGVLIAIALVAFLINVTRYFILRSGDEQARETAKWYTIYAIIAFVLIVIMWGIINLIVAGLGLGQSAPIQSDYIQTRRGGASVAERCPGFGNMTGDASLAECIANSP